MSDMAGRSAKYVVIMLWSRCVDPQFAGKIVMPFLSSRRWVLLRAIWRIRGLACAPVKESASLVYVLVRYFLHSPLGKGRAASCVVSEQQLEEGRPKGGLKLPAIVECTWLDLNILFGIGLFVDGRDSGSSPKANNL